MFATKELDKPQTDWLIEIEDQVLYLSEAPDAVELLESHKNEIAAKADIIEKMVCHQEQCQSVS